MEKTSSQAGSASVEDAAERPAFRLSVGQVFVSSLAAASAAAVASLFGVAGTVIGTALFSVVATVATAVYQHAADRTAARLSSAAGSGLTRSDLRVARPGLSALSGLPWRRILTAAALICALALVYVTAAEVGIGKPLSALLGRNSDRGTTLEHVVSPGRAKHRVPTPSVAPSGGAGPSSSSVAATPSVAPSDTSASPDPGLGGTQSPTPGPSSPAPSPAASVAPSPSAPSPSPPSPSAPSPPNASPTR